MAFARSIAEFVKVLVNKLRDFLTPENISTIAKEVVDLCERENNNSNAKRLQKLIVDNEKATENLLKALENGQAVDIMADRICIKIAVLFGKIPMGQRLHLYI